VELLSAAQSVVPALAEARIVRMQTNLRPALPDAHPVVHCEDGLVRINGLYRHGWLVAPALVERVVRWCAEGDRSIAGETTHA
jgi:glycine oxidase